MTTSRTFKTTWRLTWFICLLLASCLAQTSPMCPEQREIAPCSCSMKKAGLDIVCEQTELTHISTAMNTLKGKPNTVIFYLRLRHNNLPKLQGYMFLGLDIRHLTIHNSTLAAVEESSLNSIGNKLTQLDFSQNYLGIVPSLALRNLHHLLILNLNHNKINAIHAKAFEGLDTLEILTLYENEISSIDGEAFKGLDNRKLKRLNLGGNKLTSIPTSALSSLDMLKKLEMQENKIRSIQEGEFEGLKSLDSLGLAHNQIRSVPARAFHHLTQLNSLELDGNEIVHVDPDAFIGLEENLQYLRLGDNNLHTVPSDALRRLHRLRHLDLRANNITVLPEDAFTGYGDSISFLNLQKNLIKVLPPLVFENLNSLETLSLQNNKLTHIPEEVTETIVDTLRHIDITDNPLICDCELRWYPAWLQNLRDKDDEIMSKKRTVCMMPSEHREYSVQNIPLEKMGCVRKNTERMSSNGISVYRSISYAHFFAFFIVCLISKCKINGIIKGYLSKTDPLEPKLQGRRIDSMGPREAYKYLGYQHLGYKTLIVIDKQQNIVLFANEAISENARVNENSFEKTTKSGTPLGSPRHRQDQHQSTTESDAFRNSLYFKPDSWVELDIGEDVKSS
ncbi:hypothetical protein M0802_000005 [Mischocyttarus mexicanus]|nr:hypothetical protein M0802_000005 [Mischocyttarus mexicanus]